MINHILVVDDDPDILAVLTDSLTIAGYTVTAVGDGSAMREALANHAFTLVILDLRLPGESGLDLAREVSQQWDMPIMMLTGQGDETDRIIGLEVAADDYLMKPVNLREFVARVNAQVRRYRKQGSGTGPGTIAVATPGESYVFDHWILNITSRKLLRGDQEVSLTFGEFGLLETLVKAPQRVFSRDELLAKSRRLQSEVFDRTIDVLILRLRRKIETNPKQPQYIQTERGLGYVFRANVQHISQS